MKSPKEMDSIELLEVYSHYSKIAFRDNSEQEYIALLRLEMIERMDRGGKTNGWYGKGEYSYKCYLE